MKILYYSGTGNSLYLAKRISKSFDCEMLSIPKLLNAKKFDFEEDIIGIVFPIYYLDIPKMVDEYLSKLNINANYIFSICTYGMFAFNTKSLINRYSFKVDYTNELLMRDNFIPMFDMDDGRHKVRDYERDIDIIISHIENRENFNIENSIKRSIGNIANKFTKPKNIGLEDEKFYVDSKCNLCAICQKVCVSNNIDIQEKVCFSHNCVQCMACIQLCPQKAIHHKKEKSSFRYINKNVTVKEIIDANNY